MTEHLIARFSGEYRFLSNFHPVKVEMDGEVYPSVEHAYQAAKTNDLLTRRVIREMPTPALARSAGRSRVVTRDIRPDWEDVKVTIMLDLLRKKFRDPDLRQKLLNTGDAFLVEGNDWGDTFWGAVHMVGQNMLGVLLHIVRYEIRRSQE